MNKAADYYTAAEEVLPPPGPSSTSPAEPDPDPAPRPRRDAAAPSPAQSTLARLREREDALDVALEASFQRFCRSEITAREMDKERDELIRQFNRVVMGENIRYRGMLRRRGSTPR